MAGAARVSGQRGGVGVGGGCRSAELTLPGFVHESVRPSRGRGGFAVLPPLRPGAHGVAPSGPTSRSPIRRRRTGRPPEESVQATAARLGAEARPTSACSAGSPRIRRTLPILLARSATRPPIRWLRRTRPPRHPPVGGCEAPARPEGPRDLSRTLLAFDDVAQLRPHRPLRADAGGWRTPSAGRSWRRQRADHRRGRPPRSPTGGDRDRTSGQSLAELPASRAILFDASPRALVQWPAPDARSVPRRLAGSVTAPASSRWTAPCPIPAPRTRGCRRAGTFHLGGP